MSRPRSLRVVLTLAAALFAPGIGVVSQPALGSTADRALAASLAHGDLDPVLEALSAGELTRSVAPPAPGSVALPAVPVGFGLTGDQLAPLEVTATPVAEQSVREFVERLRTQGVDASATQWQVFTLPPVKEAASAAAAQGVVDDDPLGSSLIVPAGTVVRFVGAVFQNGELEVKTAVTASAEPAGRPTAEPNFRAMGSPSDSVTFVPAGGVGCLDRKQNSTAHYDPCQQFWRATNDNSDTREWFASEMHGTGKSHSMWRLHGLEVDSRRTKNSALQEWVNWDPGADAKGNCQDQTVGVSYAGASVSVSKPHCELWDIDKGREAFDMSTGGGAARGARNARRPRLRSPR